MVQVGLMTKLTDLGFVKNVVFETIVSTYNMNGTANAAPMGVIMENEQTIGLNLFNSSATCYNLKANRSAVINLTNDIDIFYKTTFKEANLNGKLPQDWFEKAETVNAPKLRLADATVNTSVISMMPLAKEKTKVLCKMVQISATKRCPQVYCRAMSLTLEAIIHATRVKAFMNEKGKQKEVCKLLETIENCNDVVNRTAPNSSYSVVMADLMKKIDSTRNKP
jgi:hypothetical protein